MLHNTTPSKTRTMGLLSDETKESLEKTFSFVTGNHFINYHYGAILSKSLKVLPVRDFDAQEIVPNLFLGDVYAAHNTKELKKRNITHIVTCTVGVSPPFPEAFQYKHLKILDCAAETINEHFAETSSFIASAMEEGGRVLVHCIRGVSRSATIVCAYLMTALKISHIDAVKTVRAKRPIARPNYGFMMQLEMYGGKILQPGTIIPIASVTISDQAELIGPDDEDEEPTGADVGAVEPDGADETPTGSEAGTKKLELVTATEVTN